MFFMILYFESLCTQVLWLFCSSWLTSGSIVSRKLASYNTGKLGHVIQVASRPMQVIYTRIVCLCACALDFFYIGKYTCGIHHYILSLSHFLSRSLLFPVQINLSSLPDPDFVSISVSSHVFVQLCLSLALSLFLSLFLALSPSF